MSKILTVAMCLAAIAMTSCGDRRLSPSSPSSIFAPGSRQNSIGSADYHETPVEMLPPSIGLVPDFGETTGGATVTIIGTGFDFFDGATVTFGTIPATNVVVVNAQSLTAVTPAGVDGWVDVVVTNPNGMSAALPGGFTYAPPRVPGAPAEFVISAAGVSPRVIAIDEGSRVTFVNNDSRNHDIRSNPHPVHIDCQQINEVGFLPPGASTPSGAFVTSRVCGFHDHAEFTNTLMEGRVVIRTAAAPLP